MAKIRQTKAELESKLLGLQKAYDGVVRGNDQLQRRCDALEQYLGAANAENATLREALQRYAIRYAMDRLGSGPHPSTVVAKYDGEAWAAEVDQQDAEKR